MSGIFENAHGAAGQADSLAARVDRLIKTECGAGSHVVKFGAMEDGHAGLTFGFDVIRGFDVTSGADQRTDSYVLKLAPVGVARRGNTDVYRQAPLLRKLHAAGMPVPQVPWASQGDDILDAPFIVMERLPGRVFLVWEPHESFSRDRTELREIWLQAARMLAQLHRVDWRTALSDWEEPRPLKEELDHWSPVLRHAQDPKWLAAGTELNALLAAHRPEEQPVGVVHGDFQPGNILYVNGRAGGLIDWELTTIGSQGLDLGWLLMMSDAQAWDPNWRPVAPVSPEDLVGAYREAGGPALADIDWYQALAHYRLGAIACLNVKLHRTGKRTDSLWERFAPSISLLFARGIELAGRAQSGSSSRSRT
jgi:aminoglycoside phosphotransferase (APT) family kinase protein